MTKYLVVAEEVFDDDEAADCNDGTRLILAEEKVELWESDIL